MSVTCWHCRAAEAIRLHVGFTVYDFFKSLEVAASGIVPMASQARANKRHCVVAVGYDDDSRTFIVRNSSVLRSRELS